jgi:molecular chaperone HscB
MTQNYFFVFDLPLSFDVNPGELEKSYFSEQRRFHPDRLTGKSPAERQQAITQSMLVNEAYETLKSPLKRALHLLALHGMTQDSLKPSQELLMEIMELREALSEIHTPIALDTFAQKNEDIKRDTLAKMAEAFSTPDLQAAADAATRLSYLIKIDDEIRLRKKMVSA